MPYITPERREALQVTGEPAGPGELNFAACALVDDYVLRYGHTYDTLNACIGALECAKLEIYRRLAVPYEEKKCRDNGDVFFHG